MVEKTSLQTFLNKPVALSRFENLSAHADHEAFHKSSSSAIRAKVYFAASDRFSNDRRYLALKALDRVARLIAIAGAAPIRRRRSQAVAQVSEMFEGHGGVSGTSAVLPVLSRDLSSGTTVGLAQDKIVPVSGPGMASTAGSEEGVRGGERPYGSPHAAAGRQASAMPAQKDMAGERRQMRANGPDPHAAVSTKMASAQVKRTGRSGALIDPANFAALGSVSYAAMNLAARTRTIATVARAIAFPSPSWMDSINTESIIKTIAVKGKDGKSLAVGSYLPSVNRAVDAGHVPAHAAPAWMRIGPSLVGVPSFEQAKDGLDWLKPTQVQPAAPHNTPSDAETRQSRMSPTRRDHGMQLSSAPETRGTDVRAGPDQGMGQAFPSDDVSSASFEVAGDTRQQVLDEMTRLASRPPAGVTGFNAGQMPAWLSGWTGSV